MQDVARCTTIKTWKFQLRNPNTRRKKNQTGTRTERYSIQWKVVGGSVLNKRKKYCKRGSIKLLHRRIDRVLA